MAANLAATVDGSALAVRPARVNIFERPGTPEDRAQTDRAMPPPHGGLNATAGAPAGQPLRRREPERAPGTAALALWRWGAQVASAAAVVAVLFVAIPTDPARRDPTTVPSAPRTRAL